MIKVLFVCLGNICRSPMAEFLFKDYVKKMGTESKFYIASAGTSSCEVGNPVHYGTRKILDKFNIDYSKKRAERIREEDYDEYDYILYMEDANLSKIKRFMIEDPLCKIHKITEFSSFCRDVADPYYTGNFDITYQDIMDGITSFYKFLQKTGQI